MTGAGAGAETIAGAEGTGVAARVLVMTIGALISTESENTAAKAETKIPGQGMTGAGAGAETIAGAEGTGIAARVLVMTKGALSSTESENTAAKAEMKIPKFK